MKIIERYIEKVSAIFKTGSATEHSYRSAIEDLFRAIYPDINALNEPKRVACGAPDFIVQRGNLVIGHIEAKDIGVDLRKLNGANKSQQERYLKALPNLIYTNFLDWEFYRRGKLVDSISIADYLLGVQPIPDNYIKFEEMLRDFCSQRPQKITSSLLLAEIMASKAQLIKDVLRNALKVDLDSSSELSNQYCAFKEHLIHDITPEDFSDIYAETIAYGMFAARVHDASSGRFNRQMAITLLPKSNPFLRNLFGYIAGVDLDDRIAWIIDDLAEVFNEADIAGIMKDFGKLTGQNDPFIHFYENFLAAYNPKKRKSRGVWYTPESVVSYILRAVDEILQLEFGLPQGLADTSKVSIDWDIGHYDNKGRPFRKKKEVHRVQILDPAAGTGTFLAEAIKQIATKINNIAPSMLSTYVEKDLVPRLHGFELLMASYAMCHMKLDLMLMELGYKPSEAPPRLSVYLTNSLEEGEAANQNLPFAHWLSNEAKHANSIKRDMPIMCVIGNPPYSGESSNKSDWIMSLMDSYKLEPGSGKSLAAKWVNDDYVKFIRMAENLIEKNGEGIVALITSHGYLDNPTFRGMRWHLLNTFEKIYILDLHGNSNRREAAPGGIYDQNIFDIKTGVAIFIGIKKKHNVKGEGELAQVFRSDMWGSRDEKSKKLLNSGISEGGFLTIDCQPPLYAFKNINFSLYEKYKEGILLSDLMPLHGNGIVTKRDRLNIHATRDGVRGVVEDILTLSEDDFRRKYHLPEDVRDWRYSWARQDVLDKYPDVPIQKLGYRIFDDRFIFYSGKARGLVGWPVQQIMKHYIAGPNFGLLVSKAHKDSKFAHVFVTEKPTEAIFFSATTGSNAMNMPLYLYPDDDDLYRERRINFDEKIFKEIQVLARHPVYGIPDEIMVFDYVYGALHCPLYRDVYSDFLKTDFPRIPWPSSSQEFWSVSVKGCSLRKLHLMQSTAIGQVFCKFQGEGDGIVGKPSWEDGKVWINKTQYFDGIPEICWSFQVGGYIPAQKWLKDRKDEKLNYEDVLQYQKIIKVIFETQRIMKTISLDLLTEGAKFNQ